MSGDVAGAAVAVGLFLLAALLAALKERGGEPARAAVPPLPAERYAPVLGLDEAGMTRLGAACADLLCHGPDWIARRKGAVELLNERTLRHHMSVDFAVPTNLLPALQSAWGGRSVTLAPLLLLKKAPASFTNFDLCDESGQALPLPTRSENGMVSAAVLIAAAERVLAGQGASLPRALREVLITIAISDPKHATRMLHEAGWTEDGTPISPSARRLGLDSDFSWLVQTLATSSVVVIPLGDTSNARKIVKLAYDEEIEDFTGPHRRRLLRTGWDGYSLVIEMPFVGARSFHFESHVPDGIEIIKAGLFVSTATAIEGETLTGPTRRVHLYLRQALDKRTAIAVLRLRAARGGFVAASFMAAWFVAVVLVFCCAFGNRIAENPTAAPALLLSLPGLIAAYVSRPGAHPFTARILRLARWFVIASGFLAYAAAAWVVVNSKNASGGDLRKAWIPLGVLAIVAAVGLTFTRYRPRVPAS
jgi:hypothetical protein